MTMPWFRMYNESRNDRKLDTLADDEFRVWHKLLCCASEGKDRGSIEADDRELLAIEVARGDEELLGRTLARLVKLKIVRDDGPAIVFINFLKRNYDKPSDTPQATAERQRRHREKGRDEGVTETVSRDVTPGHAQEEKRREEKRVEETIYPPSPQVGEGGGAAAPRQEDAPLPPPRFPKPKDMPPPKRPPDLLFEAVCEACDIDWHQLTDPERGKVNAAVGQIRKAGGTPPLVRDHADNYALQFTTPLTPSALAGNWAKTANPPVLRLDNRGSPNGHKPSTWELNARAAKEAF
jgi:hypothetical protein